MQTAASLLCTKREGVAECQRREGAEAGRKKRGGHQLDIVQTLLRNGGQPDHTRQTERTNSFLENMAHLSVHSGVSLMCLVQDGYVGGGGVGIMTQQ